MDARFPQEIIDTIVDHLSAFNVIRIFTALRLTSREFDLSCRRHIFRNIVLNRRRCTVSCAYSRKLYEILLSNSDIVPLIKNLRIDLIDYLAPSLSTSIPDPNDYIPRVLRQITRLAALQIEGLPPLQWNEWPSDLRSALRTLFASPCLSSLLLQRITSIPTSLFDSCPTLKSLTLDEVTFVDDLPGILQSRPCLESPKFITIAGPHPFARGLPADLTGLRNLDFSHVSAADGKILWETYIEPSSTSLVTLSIITMGLSTSVLRELFHLQS